MSTQELERTAQQFRDQLGRVRSVMKQLKQERLTEAQEEKVKVAMQESAAMQEQDVQKGGRMP